MFRLLISLVAVYLFYAHSAYAAKIATVSPISHSITQALVKGTDISVDYLPPKRLPVNRIGSWLNKNSHAAFAAYDALVGISSVAPELTFYPTLRQSNIRIVNIDIAHAIMPSGEKVVLAEAGEHFWLNSNNLLIMLGVLKRDLSALWPAQAEVLNSNYQRISSLIRRVNLQLDEKLMAADIAFVVPLDSKLLPLTSSLASDVSSEQDAIAFGLGYIKLDSGKAKQADVWYIDDFTRIAQDSLENRLLNQVDALEAVLSSR